MTPVLRNAVRARAGERCEYCHLPESALPQTVFHVEHVVAQQHGGLTEIENLALACDRCNAFKGPNLSAIDSETQRVVRLFNPRTDRWDEHFRSAGPLVEGTTEVRRATVRPLNMNALRRVQLRRALAISLD